MLAVIFIMYIDPRLSGPFLDTSEGEASVELCGISRYTLDLPYMGDIQ
jgi:hypothetical protein